MAGKRSVSPAKYSRRLPLMRYPKGIACGPPGSLELEWAAGVAVIDTDPAVVLSPGASSSTVRNPWRLRMIPAPRGTISRAAEPIRRREGISQ